MAGVGSSCGPWKRVRVDGATGPRGRGEVAARAGLWRPGGGLISAAVEHRGAGATLNYPFQETCVPAVPANGGSIGALGALRASRLCRWWQGAVRGAECEKPDEPEGEESDV